SVSQFCCTVPPPGVTGVPLLPMYGPGPPQPGCDPSAPPGGVFSVPRRESATISRTISAMISSRTPTPARTSGDTPLSVDPELLPLPAPAPLPAAVVAVACAVAVGATVGVATAAAMMVTALPPLGPTSRMPL